MTDIAGYAVRAIYIYSGMEAVAAITGDGVKCRV